MNTESIQIVLPLTGVNRSTSSGLGWTRVRACRLRTISHTCIGLGILDKPGKNCPFILSAPFEYRVGQSSQYKWGDAGGQGAHLQRRRSLRDDLCGVGERPRRLVLPLGRDHLGARLPRRLRLGRHGALQLLRQSHVLPARVRERESDLHAIYMHLYVEQG